MNTFEKIFGKATARFQSNEGSNLYELKSEVTFLEGLVGCGKTHFVKNIVEKMTKDQTHNNNFILFDARGARGDLSDIADMLLKYNYNVFVENRDTNGMFVLINRDDAGLNVSIYEADSSGVWESLRLKPNTAVVVSDLSKIESELIANRCITQLLEHNTSNNIEIVATFENIDFIIGDQNITENSTKNTLGLVSELLQKYHKNQLENIQTIFSFQDISRTPIFKDFLEGDNRYQYIRFDRGISSSGSECYTAAEKIASTKAKMFKPQ